MIYKEAEDKQGLVGCLSSCPGYFIWIDVSRTLISFVLSRIQGELDHVVIFSGTIGLFKGELIFGEKFEVELEDPVSGDRLSVWYEVAPLNYMKSL